MPFSPGRNSKSLEFLYLDFLYLTAQYSQSMIRRNPTEIKMPPRIESEIRHRKKVEGSLNEPRLSIGILNRGKNNRFINNTFEGLGIGIQDEGENTLAQGNKFLSGKKNIENFAATHPWWFAIITGVILLVIGLLLEYLV